MTSKFSRLEQRLAELGINDAIIAKGTAEGKPAIVIGWNGEEEWYTGNDDDDYIIWLQLKYADANLR